MANTHSFALPSKAWSEEKSWGLWGLLFAKTRSLELFGKLGEEGVQQNCLGTEYFGEIDSKVQMREVPTFDNCISRETGFMCMFFAWGTLSVSPIRTILLDAKYC